MSMLHPHLLRFDRSSVKAAFETRYDKIQKQSTDAYVLPIGFNSYEKEAWMFSGFLLVILMQALYYKHN